MSGAPLFAGLDGLMSLSRREGVDVRPTLLRVLTDLYVQKPRHTAEEERQFVELATRLFDQVDDATRAVVRARLSTYPATPPSIAARLALIVPRAKSDLPSVQSPALAPEDIAARGIGEEFFASATPERLAILQRLELAPLRFSTRPSAARATRAVGTLEHAALRADAEGFAAEVAAALSLPLVTATRIVADRNGETLACAMKVLDMPAEIFQRVLIFLYPARGTSVERVYRLSRLYDVLGDDAARSMIAAWRGSDAVAAPAKHQPALYDDERHRARAAAPPERPSHRPSEAFRRAARNGFR